MFGGMTADGNGDAVFERKTESFDEAAAFLREEKKDPHSTSYVAVYVGDEEYFAHREGELRQIAKEFAEEVGTPPTSDGERIGILIRQRDALYHALQALMIEEAYRHTPAWDSRARVEARIKANEKALKLLEQDGKGDMAWKGEKG